MKNFRWIIFSISLSLTLAMPVNADFIGDTVLGTGIQNGGSNIFSPSSVATSNDYAEFLGALSGIRDPDGAKDPIDTIQLQFDFTEISGNNLLIMNAYRLSGTGGLFEFSNLIVDFSGIDYNPSGFVLAGLELVIDDDDPYIANPLQGITPDYGDHSLEFVFTNFRVNESRTIVFKLNFEETDGGPNTSVVPVPAAAPMALLGLGVLALARRFRRAKS